ncbi:glypican-5-like [Daphnia carinata]|uniref:glypican-5-like n=1 Tax=Daphnia carinata TaxID=120202 RepID=UPI00257DCA7D|nr:glypican-5-like [Daphnia carinata]
MEMISAMLRVCSILVVVLMQQNLMASALPASSTSEGGSCDSVRDVMTSLKLAHTAMVSDLPVSGGAGLICEGERTCCPADVESALRQSAASDFHHAVRLSSHQLRHTLAQSSTAIQGQVVQHVRASMMKTETMFGQLYKRLALLAKAPIQQLFDQLERFVSSSADGMGGDPADVSDAVNGFFDDLFPRLYGQSPRSVQGPSLPANSVGLRLPQDYVDCLRHAQSELRPFGEIPRRLANSLARSLDAVRSLLSALDLGARVLNATDHAELNGQCRDALLRATYCAQCRALKSQQPVVVGQGGQVCRGLCSNVARGCLAAVADVDQPWNEWVDAMERLAAALLNKAGAAVADLGPHDILSSVDSRLSEAVLYALENGPLLEKKVKKMCGENGTGKDVVVSGDGDAGSADAESSSVLPSLVQPVEDLSPVLEEGQGGGLKSRLESLLPMLASARGFYSNLPDAVCAQPGTPFQAVMSDDQSNCWNGQRFAEYTKPLSGIGIGAQKYNAEVRVSRSDVDSHLVQLSDRLRHVRQVLISKTVAAPEPDSLMMEDFGSGSGDGAGGSNGGSAGTGMGGHGRSDWDGIDSEPDDDGIVQGFPGGDLDGSGSGQGPSRAPDGEWGEETFSPTKKPGSDEFELNGGETTPRVTVNEPTGGAGGASGGGGTSGTSRTSISSSALLAVCLIMALKVSSSFRPFV